MHRDAPLSNPQMKYVRVNATAKCARVDIVKQGSENLVMIDDIPHLENRPAKSN